MKKLLNAWKVAYMKLRNENRELREEVLRLNNENLKLSGELLQKSKKDIQ